MRCRESRCAGGEKGCGVGCQLMGGTGKETDKGFLLGV
jgi:hypothetical protein